MKCKLVAFLLVFAALCVPAAADVVWTPNNTFYREHRAECDYTYLYRQCILAGADGTVQIWLEPGSMVPSKVENGVQGTGNVNWTAEDGTEWVYVYGVTDSESTGGWALADDLSWIYDSSEFMADHEAEIDTETSVTADLRTCAVYEYPHGPVVDAFTVGEGVNSQYQFHTVYTDDEGVNWGYVTYHMSASLPFWSRYKWICLGDPANEHLDTGIIEPGPSVAQQRGKASVTGWLLQNQLVLAGVLVIAVVAVTAAVIVKVRPKKSREE